MWPSYTLRENQTLHLFQNTNVESAFANDLEIVFYNVLYEKDISNVLEHIQPLWHWNLQAITRNYFYIVIPQDKR